MVSNKIHFSEVKTKHRRMNPHERNAPLYDLYEQGLIRPKLLLAEQAEAPIFTGGFKVVVPSPSRV